MNKDLDLTKILKDCPKGMKLDCTMYENVTFIGLHEKSDYPISICVGGRYEYLTKEGCFNDIPEAKCVIFPKGKTTWEGFQRPFKDGDIVVTDCYTGNNQLFIFKEYDDNNDTVCYLFLDSDGTLVTVEFAWEVDRLATEEEKQKLFDAIKANGYKWNAETKTLKNLPKFKVGDVIQDKNVYEVKITEVNTEDEFYEYESIIAKSIGGIDFKEQSDWKLVSNKEVSIIINGVRYDSSCEDLGCECDTCHLRTSCDRLSSSVNEACQEILGSGYNFKKSDKKFEK